MVISLVFFGKWHLSGSNKWEYIPREERGPFNIWLGHENNNKQYDSWIHGHDIWGRDDKIADAEKLEKYETDAMTAHLINFLSKRPKDKPFFAVLSVHTKHLNPAAKWRTYLSPEKRATIQSKTL